MTQRYNLDRLKEIKNVKARREVFGKYYEECSANGIAPYLSDFLSECTSWGGMPLQYIGEAEDEKTKYGDGSPMMFTLQVFFDEWGHKYQPGDFVTRLVPNGKWRNATSQDESAAKRNGTYDKKYKNILKFKVDERGCIKCPFQSAVYFLNQYGVHSYSKEPLTKKQEFSTEPLRVSPLDTQMLHVRYWRFQEVTEEQYQKLPLTETLKLNESDDSKRNKK